MFDLVKNFILLKVQNAPAMVYTALGAVWLLLVAVGLASILSRAEKSWPWKACWACMIVLVPWGGLFLYSMVSALGSDFAFLRPFGMRKIARLDRIEPLK
jgi:hypothetical protein